MGSYKKTSISGVDPLPFVISGIIGTSVYIAVWIYASATSDLWVAGVNTFSELGVSKDTTVAAAFNYGCMVCGAMCTCLGTGKILCEKSIWNKISGGCLIVSDVFLFLSGMFDMNYAIVHNTSVFIYMLFFGLAVFTSIIGDWFFVTKINSFISMALLLVTGIALFTQPYAMFELVGTVCLLTWKGIQCIKLLIIRKKFIEMDEKKNTIASYYHSEI